MFKKIREYCAEKREARKLLMDTVKKLNNFATTVSDISDSISASGILDPRFLKEGLENIKKIADNPDLTSAYYSHIADIAHTEKLKETKRKSE